MHALLCARAARTHKVGSVARQVYSPVLLLPPPPPSGDEPRELLLLPDEILRRILAFLDGTSLAKAACTATVLRSHVDDPLWEACFRRQYGWLVGSNGSVSWQELFARLHSTSPRLYVVGVAAVPGLIAPAEGIVYTYAPHDRAWKPSESRTIVPRNMPAVTRDAEGHLVVMGGTQFPAGPTMNTLSTLQTVERYDGCRWELLPQLRVARCCAGAACDGRGVLYCVGGGESMYAQSRALSSVECLSLPHGPSGVRVADVGEAATDDEEEAAEAGLPTEPAGWSIGPSMLEARCESC